MAKKQVRNNAYYEERLKRDHPSVYTDLKVGKYKTVAEAATAAGLKQRRTRTHELKNAWSKASASEQNDFLRWLATLGVTLSPSTIPPPGLAFKVAIDRRLTPAATLRIEDIMAKRGLEKGEFMAEMGYNPHDQSVSLALRRSTRLQPDVIRALEKWLAANASI